VYRAEEVRAISGRKRAMKNEQDGESYVSLLTYFIRVIGSCKRYECAHWER
jgi:hypothetical protein